MKVRIITFPLSDSTLDFKLSILLGQVTQTEILQVLAFMGQRLTMCRDRSGSLYPEKGGSSGREQQVQAGRV